MEKLYASVTLSAPSTATAADTRGTSTRAQPKGGGCRLSTKGQRREMTGPITELINPSAVVEAVEAGEPPLKYSTIVTRIKAQTKADKQSGQGVAKSQLNQSV